MTPARGATPVAASLAAALHIAVGFAAATLDSARRLAATLELARRVPGPVHAPTVVARRRLAAIRAAATHATAPFVPGTLVALALAAAPLVAQVPRDTVPEEVLVELRLGRIARQTVRAFRVGETPLLPATALFRLGEVDYAIDSTGMTVRRQPQDVLIRLVPGSDTAIVGSRRVGLPPGAVLAEGGEVFVSATALETLLDLAILAEWSDLTVTVLNPEALPLGQRVRRAAERRALLERERARGPDLLLQPKRDRIAGFVADWTVFGVADDPANTTSYSVGAGTQVWGGALEVTARSEGPAAHGVSKVDASYLYVWRERPWLTQVRVGDGFATGPRVRPLRGLAVTNAPFVRPSAFGVTAFEGRIAPGWDVEARQQGRLVDVSRADEQGAFALDIPVRYGDNPIQIVAFGPHGEIVTSSRLLRLNTERLSGGRFEYGASIGDCRAARCEATGNADLRYGVSDRRWWRPAPPRGGWDASRSRSGSRGWRAASGGSA